MPNQTFEELFSDDDDDDEKTPQTFQVVRNTWKQGQVSKPFDQTVEQIFKSDKHYHERITGPCIPYSDYDDKKDKKPSKEYRTKCWKDFKEAMRAGYPNCNIIFANRSGQKPECYKISFRAYVRGAGYYKSTTHCKQEVMRRVNPELVKRGLNILDPQVYNRNATLGVVTHTKMGDPRVLKISGKGGIDRLALTLVQNIADEHYNKIDLEVDNSIRNLKKIADCDGPDRKFWEAAKKLMPELVFEYVQSNSSTSLITFHKSNDECPIHGRVHPTNRAYVTWHKDTHIGYLRCYNKTKPVIDAEKIMLKIDSSKFSRSSTSIDNKEEIIRMVRGAVVESSGDEESEPDEPEEPEPNHDEKIIKKYPYPVAPKAYLGKSENANEKLNKWYNVTPKSWKHTRLDVILAYNRVYKVRKKLKTYKNGRNTFADPCNFKGRRLDELEAENEDVPEVKTKPKTKKKKKTKKYDFSDSEEEVMEGDSEETFGADRDENSDYSLFMGGDLNQARLFKKYMSDDVKILDAKTGYGYVYSAEKCLWVENQGVSIACKIPVFLESKYKEIMDTELTIYEETLVKKLKNVVCSTSNMKKVFAQVKTLMLVDKNAFYRKLNSSKYLMAIREKKVIDLRTGEISDRKREHMFSNFCDVSKVAVGPAVHKLMDPITCNRPDLKKYMQKLFGLGFTGCFNRQFWVLHGVGANGKTALFEIIEEILGPYYHTMNKDAIMKSKSHHKAAGRPTPELTPLKGTRFVVTQELEKDDVLNDSLVKKITECQTLNVRNLNEDMWKMVYYCILLIGTNFAGKIDTNDQAIIDRAVYLPLDARFVDNPNPKNPFEFKKDKDFADSFKTGLNKDMFFSWCVEGAIEFFKEGLEKCKCIIEKTNSVILKMDTLQQFINDRFDATLPDKKACVRTTRFFQAYKKYCTDDLGIPAQESAKSITQLMKKKGFEYKKTSRKYYGLSFTKIIDDEAAREKEQDDKPMSPGSGDDEKLDNPFL